MDDATIGRAIRAVRVRRRLRQIELADVAGVSQSTISRIELGRLERVPLGTLRRVGTQLGMRVSLVARWEGADLDRLLGGRHSAMLEEVSRLFASLPDWTPVPEVTFAFFAERGVIDILAWHAPTRSLLVIELKTELVDVQETVGTLDRKVRLATRVAAERGWVPASVSSWLLIADSSTNGDGSVRIGRCCARASRSMGARSRAGFTSRTAPSMRSRSSPATGRVLHASSLRSDVSGRGRRACGASPRPANTHPAGICACAPGGTCASSCRVTARSHRWARRSPGTQLVGR